MSYNILIVDDSKVTREILARTIRLSGLDVGEIFQASHGREALEVLDREWTDLIFADINMPVMDGLELVAELQKRDDWERLPVVIVSTEGSRERVEELKRIGVSGYIRKPFTPEQVAEMIQQLVGEQSGV